MFGMNVMAWNGGDLEKLEVLQNMVGRLALGAPKWTAAEALRGDLGWSLFSERMVKAVLNYKSVIMYSFEGEHRKRPNVSLSGASRLLDKAAFLEKLRKERESRENNKKREIAAVRLQSFVRGWLCRIHTNQKYRQSYDEDFQSIPSPLTEQAARGQCLKMLRMFRIKHDAHRLSLLCTLLVRQSSSLLQWVTEHPGVWLVILSKLLSLSLQTICSCEQGVSHAGPLRLLEVLTQPQAWAALPSVAPSRQAHFVFSFLMPLIDRGYFKYLIKLLVLKVPEVNERGGESSSPLAASILALIFYPIFLVATCRRPAEKWAVDSIVATNLPWVKVLKAHVTSVEETSLGARKLGSAQLKSAPTSSDYTLENRIQVTHDSAGRPIPTELRLENESMDLDSQEDDDDDDGGPIKPAKLPRDDSESAPLAQESLTTADRPAGVDGFECNSQLLCYAFCGVPVACPSNFINLTLYNLVDQLFAASKHSQVHNLLAPHIEASKLLLCHPSASHSLIQAIHHVLLHTQPSISGSPDTTDAPTQLMVLLTLLPIKTVLPTTSLQLYLLSCRRLVHDTVHFLPLRKQSSLPSSSDRLPEEQQQEEEEETESEEESDEEDEEMTGRRTGDKVIESPPTHLIEVGEWCLSHINSPEYVSWVLDEVEAAKMDREVLTEFCGLTHTLLTAPCLSLFQCRLLYGVAGRHRMQRAMWALLTSLYPSWVTAPTLAHDKSGRGTRRLLDTVSRGAPLDPGDRDTLVPVLASFSTALLAVLATLHDSELVISPEDAFENMFQPEGQAPLQSSGSPGKNSGSFAFSVRELVTISATLRDVCVGLAELAHPDTRASTLTDVSYKPTWDHCFKCCVDVVRHLHLRDTRRQFCPAQHWLTNRVSLPDIPHTASYRSLLGARASRRRAFMPTRWRTRAQLLAESVGKTSSQLSVYEKVRATLLQELPFVFSFTDRAEVFLRLVQEDRNTAQEHSAFNVGPYISLRVRRTHIYEDSFDKLSPENESNMRLSLRVQLLNPAGAVEAGVDGGGLFREFLSELLKSSFDPNRGFFLLTRENTLYPNPTAHLLHEDFQAHYYFIGRMLGKALYEKLLVEIPLAGFFLSKLLSRKGFSIEFHHLDSLDPELCRNLLYLKTYQGDYSELGLDFTILVSELGHNRVVELVPDGANVQVTADNKIEYIYRMADFKLNKQIAKQCYAFRKGLHDVVSAEWLQLFDWRELQTMISGSATPVDIADLKKNANYSGDYNAKHKTIKLFWQLRGNQILKQVVEQFDEQQRRQLLKFVTSCSRPPLLGFKDLHPPFCIQPSGSDQRLPSAATCMNLLKLPEYRDPITLKEKLLYSITSNAGFELS
ncbi:HECT domain [Trinorchestia longiramus]|nr:HECT domain [Trinorchestia longiramus]